MISQHDTRFYIVLGLLVAATALYHWPEIKSAWGRARELDAIRRMWGVTDNA